MSVYGAMNAAVSGMRAQSKSLGNISDNIANSQTVGFKRIDTSFSELVTLSNRSAHAPGGVIATPRYRHSIQGDISQTQITTNMAISGKGFFVVSKPNDVTPQGVTFDAERVYSRRGDFEVDKFGYLRNGGGYYLNGRQVLDQNTLNTSDINQPIRIETNVMEARGTSSVKYNANLPADAAAFPSGVVTSTGVSATPEEVALSIDYSLSGGAYVPADRLHITIDGTTFSSPGGLGSTALEVDNLRTQLIAAFPNLTVAAAGSVLTVTAQGGATGDPSFQFTVAEWGAGPTVVNSAAITNQVTTPATSASQLVPEKARVNFSAAAPGETLQVTLNGQVFSATVGASGLDAAIDSLRSSILTTYPTYNVLSPGNGGTSGYLEINGSSTSPRFDVTFTGHGSPPANNAALLATTPAYRAYSFAGTPQNGDVLSISVNNTTYSVTFTATMTLNEALGLLADQVDATELRAIGPGETDITGAIGAGSGQLLILEDYIDVVTESPQVAGGENYALTLANGDEDAMYAAAGSFSGGAVTIYNGVGAPLDVQLRWVNTGAPDEWTLLAKDPAKATGSQWTSLGTFGFTEGLPTTYEGGTFTGTINIPPNTFQGFPNDITLDFTGIPSDDGTANHLLTQFYADDIAVYRLDQDGYQAGILTDVFINDFGYVVANYDNGRSQVLFQVPLATFASPNELERMDGGSFKRTPESGDALVAESGQSGAGDIVASAIEQSNVDLADEFTKMIVTQRAYSANSRTVRTADEMLEEVVNLKR